MDRTTSMATFVRVVDAGGFASAGRALGMSPSTVTEHVHALEARLGVRLLNRSTRKISLTEVGGAYYERSKQILADLDDADRIAHALHSSPRGTLRLNTSVAIPPFLAPVIAEYGDLHPDVSVNLSMTESMVDMVGEGLDLAVRDSSVTDLSLIARRVATYRFVVCGAPSYLKRRGTPQKPADLREHNCLGCSHSAWGDGWRFAGSGGEQLVALTGNLQSNSANALRLAALHGQGLIMSPMFLVADEIKAGRLVSILQDFLKDEHAINAIYPHRQHVPAKVRSFIDLAIRYFREHPTWADPCKAKDIDRPQHLHAENVTGTARLRATSGIAFDQVGS
jgi:DNA-binding transcriptional LysR family regulator